METSSKEAGEPVDMILHKNAAQVLYDGMQTDPQLDHPEGVAVHRDGSVWCGGERGQIIQDLGRRQFDGAGRFDWWLLPGNGLR
jgi:hypothetical protein